jgi:hypothetical protein
LLEGVDWCDGLATFGGNVVENKREVHLDWLLLTCTHCVQEVTVEVIKHLPAFRPGEVSLTDLDFDPLREESDYRIL